MAQPIMVTLQNTPPQVNLFNQMPNYLALSVLIFAAVLISGHLYATRNRLNAKVNASFGDDDQLIVMKNQNTDKAIPHRHLRRTSKSHNLREEARIAGENIGAQD
ncbi:hypothetical protein CDD82_818 [Ophiocordyceps australis]|uniref:Uncharacterized protein n=1 Tax=Ophiocordyceps australis TaxID=1399860 RepID=A0A2C5YTJ0_9HYPO|nr:hypothetical protein CDD82_818 [Ophiocordyceps australis]